MPDAVKIGDKLVGEGHPAYLVAEIGLNHNGSVDTAKRLIDVAILAGCDAVKFQKRTPELAVPPEMRNVMRETPWGTMTYLDYRHRVEFGIAEYQAIDAYCRERSIPWFASPWDEPSVDFLEKFDVPCHKIPSAALTDHALVRHAAKTGRPIVLSTGMSTIEQIEATCKLLDPRKLILLHTTSTYPCTPAELNLRAIRTLRETFGYPTGYSGHEVGLQTTYAAVVLGACFIERHITLDRAMWGSDHGASVEPQGLIRLVRDIRTIESSLGDGVKRVYESEVPIINRLRRVR
jgi:N-acetylneuraminate synthase